MRKALTFWLNHQFVGMLKVPTNNLVFLPIAKKLKHWLNHCSIRPNQNDEQEKCWCFISLQHNWVFKTPVLTTPNPVFFLIKEVLFVLFCFFWPVRPTISMKWSRILYDWQLLEAYCAIYQAFYQFWGLKSPSTHNPHKSEYNWNNLNTEEPMFSL